MITTDKTSTAYQAISEITSREQEVLHLIAHEHSSKEIAKKLYVSYETIHSHRKNIMTKLGVRNTAGMVRVAFERQLLRVTLSVMVLMCWGISTHAQELHLDVEGHARIVGKVNVISAVGDSSVFIGANAGKNDDGGNDNTFVGGNAGRSNTSGQVNSFFGVEAGKNNIAGYNNSFFGVEAGRNNTFGSSNSFFGVEAGKNNISGNDNSFFGERAGKNNISGTGNSFFGYSAGNQHNNTRSTMLGFGTGTLASLDKAIAIGYDAEVKCNNCAVIGGTGADAVKVGIGTDTVVSDLHIKQSQGVLAALGTGGITFEDPSIPAWNWQIGVGNGNFQFVNQGMTKAFIQPNGDYVDLVALRDDSDPTKSSISNVKSMDQVLDKVRKLRPSTKQVNRNKNSHQEWGFVAEEVAKLFPEITPEINGHRGIIPHYFGILSIKAIQEQQVIIEEQRSNIQSLTSENKSQQAEISQLKDRLSKLESLIKQVLEEK